MRTAVVLLILPFLLCASVETYGDLANTIEATAEKEFVITLDANATTGYEWQLANPIDDSLIKLVSSEYVPERTDLTGSGGKSIWTFRANRSGKASVSLKYVRSWEKDVQPVKKATYIVNIQESIKASEAPRIINTPPSAHWSDEEPGWGEESQDE